VPWQGKFQPKNPGKYVGDVKGIFYRSSLEYRLMKHLDSHPDVLQWNSEEIVIPYIKPQLNVDPQHWRVHRYFVDMAAKVKRADGTVKTYLIEVKPFSQCNEPPPPKTRKQNARYLGEMVTYRINQAKWDAAKAFCKKQGWEFLVMTDHDLKY